MGEFLSLKKGRYQGFEWMHILMFVGQNNTNCGQQENQKSNITEKQNFPSCREIKLAVYIKASISKNKKYFPPTITLKRIKKVVIISRYILLRELNRRYIYIFIRQMKLSRQSMSQNINSSNKKAHSTPALLFYKPNQPESEPCCQNHRNKVAEYAGHIQDDEYIYYCQKCAILLIRQGFKVTKLNEPQKSLQIDYPERQEEIEQFVWCLKNTYQEIESKIGNSKAALINSEEFYGTQIEEINEYFDVIYQSLELEKNKCYNYILQERKNAEQETRALYDKLTFHLNDVEHMINDIEENLISVYTIIPDNYYYVMKSFRDKFEDCVRFVESSDVREVELRKIQFVGVPESIHSLSEILINSTNHPPEPAQSYQTLQRGQNPATLMFSFEGSRGQEDNYQWPKSNKHPISHKYDYELDQSSQDENDNEVVLI